MKKNPAEISAVFTGTAYLSESQEQSMLIFLSSRNKVVWNLSISYLHDSFQSSTGKCQIPDAFCICLLYMPAI